MCKKKGHAWDLQGLRKDLAKLRILSLETGWREWTNSRLTDGSWALGSDSHATQSRWHGVEKGRGGKPPSQSSSYSPVACFRSPSSKGSCVDSITWMFQRGRCDFRTLPNSSYLKSHPESWWLPGLGLCWQSSDRLEKMHLLNAIKTLGGSHNMKKGPVSPK